MVRDLGCRWMLRKLLIFDLLPQVLFATGGAVKLADFGLAKILDNGIQQAVSFVGVSWVCRKPHSRTDRAHVQLRLGVTYLL